MTSPLSPTANTALNVSTSPLPTPAMQRNDDYEVQAYTVHDSCPDEGDTSSPFVSCVTDGDQENASPNKPHHSRVRSGAELSPLKILSSQKHTEGEPRTAGGDMGPPRLLPRSPRKSSPVKRFPVKVSNPLDDVERHDTKGRSMELDDVMRDNEGLKRAIDIFEDEQSIANDNDNSHMAPPPPPNNNGGGAEEEDAGPDDTIASTFSAFSAVPNMATFSKVGASPARQSPLRPATSRANHGDSSWETSSRSAPARKRESENTTNLLMDFTEQLRNPHKSPVKGGGLLPVSRTSPNVSATPGRRMSNLIDFDIPPMPTPRSVPSITPRELESLKSGFLSEISSLKASLSGKEAEVNSLKSAVGDAEKRVGASLEQLREEQLAKERLAVEKEDWEMRGRELESLLCKAKEEMVSVQDDRDELERKLDESEKRREAAEMMHQEAESKMAGMRAGGGGSPGAVAPTTATREGEIEAAVERVARELHGLYKSKHETKVTALKKSYESRWQKKVKELESRIEELRAENEKLRGEAESNANASRIASAAEDDNSGAMRAQTVRDSASIKELKADVQRLEAVVSTVQRDNDVLRSMLERERVEKGELVQLAEEMMSMQNGGAPTPASQERQPHPDAPATKTPKRSHEGFRGSTRTSGIRAPGSAVRGSGAHERPRTSATPGLPRPRSGIMSSIERMGSHRGRGGE